MRVTVQERGLVPWLDRRFYPTQVEYWDDDIFRATVLEHLRANLRLLDIGAGAGILPQTNFRGLASEVVGIDLDPRVTSNPHLDRGIIADCTALPFPDASFDVVVADNVLEHLDQPRKGFAEISRVLRPGGTFVAKTPNKWHYMPTIARLTPTWFHRWFNALRGRSTVDTFPTRYRANTVSAIRRLAAESGMEPIRIRRFEGRPEYLRLTFPTYVAGLAYERVVNSTDMLGFLRILLVIELRKRA
jgi:SAM-dependent methyltransferase